MMTTADPRLAWLFPAALAWIILLIIGRRLSLSLKTGTVLIEAPGRGVAREAQPRAFWSLIVLMCALFVAAVAVAAILTLYLFAALTGAVPPQLLFDRG